MHTIATPNSRLLNLTMRWPQPVARPIAVVGVLLGCGSEPQANHVTSLPTVNVSIDADLILDPNPLIVVGGARDQLPGHALHLVEDAIILEGGALIVAAQGSRSLRYFDSSGNFVRESGGQGDGPGEFQRVRSIHRLAADTIAAWDGVQRRITIFDPSGEAVGTLSLGHDNGVGELLRGNSPVYVYSLGARTFIVAYESIRLSRRPNGFSRDSLFVAVLDRSARQVASFGKMPGAERYRTNQTGILAPYSYKFHAAATPLAFYLGNGRGPDLVEHSADGLALRRLKLPIERKALSSSDLKNARDRFAARTRPELRPMIGALFEKAAVVDSVPAFTDLQAGSNGSLWVQLYDFPAKPRRWLVVDASAGTARPVVLPPDVTLLDATADKIVIRHSDELGRQEVRVHRIIDPSARARATRPR